MKCKDGTLEVKTSKLGTPKDYTDDLYLVYFEVAEHEGKAKRILEDFLGENRKGIIQTHAHGYLVEIAMQCIPEIVRSLANKNIAVYQVIRITKLNDRW